MSKLQETNLEQPDLLPVMAPVHDKARGAIGLKQPDFAAALA